MRLSKLDKIFDYCSAGALGAVMLLTVAAVFQRYVMSSPIPWLEEVNGLLFLWAIMLGSVAAKRAGSHLSIDIITSRLPEKAQLVLAVATELITMAVMGLMGWYGYVLASGVQYKITNVLGISFAYIDYAIPAGALGIALFSVVNIIALIKNGAVLENQESVQ